VADDVTPIGHGRYPSNHGDNLRAAHKHAVQKQVKVDARQQKKNNSAASAKQVPETKK